MRSSALALLSLALLGGCERQVMESSAVDTFGAPEAELEYLEALEQARAVTNNDALHGLLVLADGSYAATDYAGRVALAKEKGWIGSGWDRPANESASVGMVAVAACQIMDVRGGLTMRIFGPSDRYCTRELIVMGMLPQRSQNQSLSGLEFSDLIRHVERRTPLMGRSTAVDLPSSTLPDSEPAAASPGYDTDANATADTQPAL